MKTIFRQEWTDFDRKYQERFSYKPLDERRETPFKAFLEELHGKSLRDRDFVVERITTSALEIFTRHRNLGVHGSTAAINSGEELVLWQEAVGVHHLAQGMYKRIQRFIARPTGSPRKPERES